jgi:hypothetical protein
VADFFIGLDLGQSQDYTALAVVQKVPTYEKATGKHGTELQLRHLERYALKTPYTVIADHIKELVSGPPFNSTIAEGDTRIFVKHRPAQTELVVDKTGVGVAVTDLLTERRLRYIGVTITGMATKVNRNGTRDYSVPKQDLVGALEVPFHTGRLKIAAGLELWSTLRDELLSFKRKQNPRTAHIRYEHWREYEHDDLVLAAALACWKADYKTKGTTRLKVIR